MPFRDATGSTSVLLVGVVAAVAVGVSVVGAAARTQVDLVRAATVADSAAIAGAAAAVGLVRGPPCALASEVAARSGGRLDVCTVDEATVTVRAVIASGVFAVGATSRAGPDTRSAM